MAGCEFRSDHRASSSMIMDKTLNSIRADFTCFFINQDLGMIAVEREMFIGPRNL
jgi:hypothetical protein